MVNFLFGVCLCIVLNKLVHVYADYRLNKVCTNVEIIGKVATLKCVTVCMLLDEAVGEVGIVGKPLVFMLSGGLYISFFSCGITKEQHAYIYQCVADNMGGIDVYYGVDPEFDSLAHEEDDDDED